MRWRGSCRPGGCTSPCTCPDIGRKPAQCDPVFECLSCRLEALLELWPLKCHCVWLQLYTSGSTGKPKGVEHTTAGYMVGASTTFKYVFDHRQSDIYWCTADCGWITGHSYVTYGEAAFRHCLN